MSSAVNEPSVKAKQTIPPLENGDRLTRAEFERRYDAMPQLKKAELIEGVVHMPSPVRLEHHAEPHAHFMGWLVYYRAFTAGVRCGDNGTIRLDLDNEPQPDAFLFIDPASGGHAQIDEDDYITHAPELVGEVTSSRASYDLHTKLTVYRRNEVREYVVWRVQDRAVDWFVLREGQYEAAAPDANGIYRSVTFPGLWLDMPGLLRDDLPAVFAAVQQGLATAEHAAFVARLQANSA